MSQDKIDALYARIKDLEDNLPYADHGAYSQDKERIRKLYEEVANMKAQPTTPAPAQTAKEQDQ